jgi:hypothetical protein
MRILVCGSRYWDDYTLIESKLREFGGESAGDFPDVIVIDGVCRGADCLANEAAHKLRYGALRFPADWETHGKAAGPIRNQKMLDDGRPDLVLAFHDNIENSKGTKDMVSRARKAGVPVEIIKHDN